MMFAVRVTLGREESVMEKIAEATRRFEYKVYSTFMPKDVRGYIFIEAEGLDDVRSAIRGINNARGVVNRPVEMKEVEQSLEAKPVEIKLSKSDLVEIVSDPFRGEKAKVIRIDPVKREVTVEMVEAAVPIPMTLPIEAVRLIRSGP
ncbi:MAG: transcription elongation factor Spt5 [Candidatus Altiarchaeota archaeon]|nr:transcription elongation factor Spt5 [Candidatus Altiarchaeota archaeon]